MDSFEIEQEGGAIPEPVSQSVCEGNSSIEAETNSENAGVFLKQLRDQIKTLHAKFLRVEEEKTKIAVSYELEKKELKEAQVLLYSKFNELNQKVESEVRKLKAQNSELEKRLQDEQLQRQGEEKNYVIKTTELKKLITEKDDSLVQLNQKVHAEILVHKEQIRELSEQVKKNERQLCSLHTDIQTFNAGLPVDENEIDISQNEDMEQDFDKLDPLCIQAVQLQTLPIKKTKFSIDDGSQSEESEDELGDILDHFVTTTSMHGIGQIIGNKWIVLRILWILLTLGALGGLIFHLYSIIDSYRKWPKQTQVSLGLNNSVYPAITLCNENLIRKDALEHMDELSTLKTFVNYINQIVFAENYTSLESQMVDEINSQKVKSLLDTFGSLYGSLQATEDEKYMIEAALNRSFYNGYESDRDVSYLLEEIFQTIYMNVDRDSRSQASHQMSEMLISCTFNGYTCYPENFTLYQTSSLGNCWTISNPEMTAETTGPRAGLSLVLFLQNHEFLEGISHGYGARLAIHAQGTKPVPTEEGIFISSASETNIGLSKGRISRVGSPHGKCNDGMDFQETYNFSYSRQACQIMCLMEETLSTCGCYGNFHEEFAILINESAHVCNTTHKRRCLNGILQNLEEETKICVCDNPCSETYFYSSVSTRQWPTDAYAHLLLEKVCQRDLTACQKLKEDTDSRHLLNNFVKVNIFFETLNYEAIEEKPLMDTFQFLASIGGALGLWVGLSVLSFCEIVQLVVKILDFMFCPQKCIRVPAPKT